MYLFIQINVIISGDRVTRSLVLCVCFVDRSYVICLLSIHVILLKIALCRHSELETADQTGFGIFPLCCNN